MQRSWPAEGATRVPYWVYQDEDIYREEQRRIFHGPTWNYLCLEAELPDPGSYITTFVGEMPVVVARGKQGGLHAFENRCAHRGALIVMHARGRAERFNCIYHNWTYDHAGNLTNVAFRKWKRSAAWCSAPCRTRRRGSPITSARRSSRG